MLRRSFAALIWLYSALAGLADEDISWSRLDLDTELGLQGLSGLEVSSDGSKLHLINDKAQYFYLKLTRENGVLSGYDVKAQNEFSGTQGRQITPYSSDSEGLAWREGGPVFVSFEGWARVWRYDTPQETALYVPRMDRFEDMKSNGSLEALGIAPDGALFTISERHRHRKLHYPMFRYHQGTWEIPFYIPRSVAFAPVGMDIDDEGRIYLLERSFQNYAWRSQVRRFALDGSGGEILFRSDYGEHDNLEGLTVWRDDTGALRLLMVSDNNFTELQTSEFVEYVLPN
ncbi:MAG: esterase-like activity of phytase family protein [Pseudomonadota bacterium]